MNSRAINKEDNVKSINGLIRLRLPLRKVIILWKIHRKINHAGPFNRRLTEINVRGSCNHSKHKCIADTGSIRRSAVACRTDTGMDVARDYPVIRPGAALR